MAEVSLAQFEVIDEAYSALIRMDDFMTCADPRRYVRLSNALFDACVDAGMAFDEADHFDWATKFIADCLSSATKVAA